jgi:hypothetical protein
MFYEKVHDKGDNLVDNPNIYNVEGDNWLSPGLQPPDNHKCSENPFFSIRFLILFSIPEMFFVF